VFSDFDQVLMLADGKTAYRGHPEDIMKHCAKIGCPGKEFVNPAEHFLELVNRDFTDSDVVDSTIQAWSVSDGFTKNSEKQNDFLPILDQADAKRPSFISQTVTLVRRHGVLVRRDPLVYTGRAIALMFGMIFFAVVYHKSRDRMQAQVLNKMWCLLWHVGVPAQLACVAVLSTNSEARAVANEVKNGMGSASAYLVSNILLQIPAMFVLSLFSCVISGYGIAGWWMPHFGHTTLMLAATLWSFEAVAQSQAVAFENPILGLLNFMNWWFVSFLFGGIMVARDDIVWPLKLFTWITPHTYSLRTLVNLEIVDSEFEGAEACVAGPEDLTCKSHGNSTEGWRCSDPNLSPMNCYGRTGGQVLDSIGQNFSTITSESTFWEDLSYVLILGVVFKCMFVILMSKKCTAATKILAPKQKPIVNGAANASCNDVL